MNRGRGKRGRGINQQPSQYNLRSAPILKTQELVDSSQVGTTIKMAKGFVSRDDPEYLKSMEDELATKGLLLRPEYYVQYKDKGIPVKNLDHSKLSFKELMSGMGRVMLHLSKTGGEVTSYIEHFSFLTRKAGAHAFVDSAFVGYERHVPDQFINSDG